jgi:hypothetical protein
MPASLDLKKLFTKYYILLIMEISRKDQIEFAKHILDLLEDTNGDLKQMEHLYKLTSHLVSWVGDDNGIAINLNSYVYELLTVAQGSKNDGWLDEYKKRLYEEIELGGRSSRLV